MSRIQCKCGEVLSNGECPNDVQYKIFNDSTWISIISKERIDPMLDIPEASVDFWKCTNCGRIYIWRYGEDHPMKVYKIEDDFGGEW